MATAPGKRRLLYADLSESELRKCFIKPYNKGGQLLVGGDLIDFKQISSVTISRTKRRKYQILEELRAASRARNESWNRDSRGVVFFDLGRKTDDEIVDIGMNVTSDFLSGGPGERKWHALMHNPWTTGIGLALLGALLTYIGLKG